MLSFRYRIVQGVFDLRPQFKTPHFSYVSSSLTQNSHWRSIRAKFFVSLT